jgi:hypothetical protein
MTIDSTRDVLFFVSSVVLVWVGGFLCWSLYELATLLRKANRVVDETEEKILRVERAVMAVKEKVESSLSYMGILAEGGKALMGLIGSRKAAREEDEEEEDEEVVPKTKKKKSQLFKDVGMEE